MTSSMISKTRHAWLLLLLAGMVDASVSPSEFNQYWKDPDLILESLQEYQALWIKVHNCVWSECAVDDNDDDGEGRDGDENWYQARTQEFCANVAFSLYGIPKNSMALPLAECSRGTYIDSFFTYGGADTLLYAIGKNPHQYFDDDDDGNYNNNNYNNYGDDYVTKATTSPNANCHVLADDDNYNWEEDGQRVLSGDYEASYDWEEAQQQQEQDNSERALSGSGDYADLWSGVSTTMGCAANGNFALAMFQGQTCDGNYFLDTTDKVRKYNRDIKIGCLRVWGRAFGKDTMIYNLLMNSWSCDLDLYPKGCPDPYGFKQRRSNALRAVGNGMSPSMAIWNGRLKFWVRLLSWTMFSVGILLAAVAYYHRNKDRIKGKGVAKGFVKALLEDYQEYRRQQDEKRAMDEAEKIRRRQQEQDAEGGGYSPTDSKREKKKKRKKKKSSSRRRSKDEYDEDVLSDEADQDEGDIEMDAYHRHRSRSRSGRDRRSNSNRLGDEGGRSFSPPTEGGQMRSGRSPQQRSRHASSSGRRSSSRRENGGVERSFSPPEDSRRALSPEDASGKKKKKRRSRNEGTSSRYDQGGSGRYDQSSSRYDSRR